MDSPHIQCPNPECNYEGSITYEPKRGQAVPLEHVYCPFCGCPPQKVAPRNIFKLRWYRLKQMYERELLHVHINLMESVEKYTVAGKPICK